MTWRDLRIFLENETKGGALDIEAPPSLSYQPNWLL